MSKRRKKKRKNTAHTVKFIVNVTHTHKNTFVNLRRALVPERLQ